MAILYYTPVFGFTVTSISGGAYTVMGINTIIIGLSDVSAITVAVFETTGAIGGSVNLKPEQPGFMSARLFVLLYFLLITVVIILRPRIPAQ